MFTLFFSKNLRKFVDTTFLAVGMYVEIEIEIEIQLLLLLNNPLFITEESEHMHNNIHSYL